MDYTREQIDLAWDKARAIDGYDASLFRQDACGAWIRRDMYNIPGNDYGWTIDLVYPEALGGTPDCPDNIRALNCRNAVAKGNDYPSYETAVRAEGINNIEHRVFLVVNDLKRAKLRDCFPGA